MNEELKKEAGEKFDKQFLIEPNLGQKKHCDICGHDHTETGNNEGYGVELKLFIEKYIDHATLAERDRLDDILTKRMKEYSNTPVAQRKNAFDELYEVRVALQLNQDV